MRMATNILTEDPQQPSGAYRFWTWVIRKIAKRLELGEELRLPVSPKSGHLYQYYGPDLSYITHPCTGERRNLRTLSERLYSPVRLPPRPVDVLGATIAALAAAGPAGTAAGPRAPAGRQFTWGARRVNP
jgi:hypothetical protein